MIDAVTVTNYLGQSLTMELRYPEKSGISILNIDGLGPGQANINTTPWASADGSVYNSAHYNERTIDITIRFVETATESIEAVRLKTYAYFPLKKEVTLIITTENRVARITGYVTSNVPTVFAKTTFAVISIQCPFPYFRAYSPQESVFYGGAPLFTFPFSNESLVEPLIIMSEFTNSYMNNIYYTGDGETGLVFQMFMLGDATDITLYRSGTSDFMMLNTDAIPTLTPFVLGDIITISTVKGSKYATLTRNGIPTSIFNAIDKDSDWFQLMNGNNIIGITAVTGLDNIELTVRNDILYEGV